MTADSGDLSTVCLECAHFWDVDDTRRPRPFGLFCDAFPSGIPEEITNGRADHRTPYADDRGVRFQLGPSRSTDQSTMERHWAHIGQLRSGLSGEQLDEVPTPALPPPHEGDSRHIRFIRRLDADIGGHVFVLALELARFEQARSVAFRAHYALGPEATIGLHLYDPLDPITVAAVCFTARRRNAALLKSREKEYGIVMPAAFFRRRQQLGGASQ